METLPHFDHIERCVCPWVYHWGHHHNPGGAAEGPGRQRRDWLRVCEHRWRPDYNEVCAVRCPSLRLHRSIGSHNLLNTLLTLLSPDQSSPVANTASSVDTALSILPTSTYQSPATSSRPSLSSLTPTQTPTVSQTPKFQVRIGNAQGQDFKKTVGFLDDGTAAGPCSYATILEVDGGDACGVPFNLADGFQYVWNGCGGQTWVTWRNPAGGNASFADLGECKWAPRTYACPDNVTVNSVWLCPRDRSR